LKRVLDSVGTIPSVLFTFLVVMIGWVFFSIESFEDAINYIKILFSFNFKSNLEGISIEFYTTLLFAVLFSFIGLSKLGMKLQTTIYKEVNYSVLQAFIVLFVGVLLYGISASYITATGFNPFIYFRF
jgi:alginate O-acetyltransferase complex protein AlgI